jgi:transposase
MMGENRQTSTAEFTPEAVRLVTVHGYGVANAARNVGINATMLGRWTRAQEARADRACPGKGRLSPEQEELHCRREEHTRLRMAREMLKTAAAFCANALS